MSTMNNTTAMETETLCDEYTATLGTMPTERAWSLRDTVLDELSRRDPWAFQAWNDEGRGNLYTYFCR